MRNGVRSETSTGFRFTFNSSLIVLLILLLCNQAQAQQDHAMGHVYYKNWINKDGGHCCNNEDCGVLAPADERVVGDRIEVRIDGQWCEVKSNHYLKSGNAPDWSVSHACIRKTAPWQIIPPCSRLLCYQPKPMF